MEKADILQNEFPIKRVLRVIRAENKNRHKRSYVEDRYSDVFVYIISGSCDYACEDGTRFSVKTGDIMYLAAGESYSLYINEDYQFIFCDFEFCEKRARKSAVFTPKDDSYAEKLFVKLLNLYNSQPKTYFTDSLTLIYSIYSAIISTKNDFYMPRSVRDKLLDIKAYIDSAYGSLDLTVSELARQADMSEVYFRKLYKAEFGISPSKYIISVRLKKAKQLMKNYPFLTLEECAKQSGFSSLHYFDRVFRSEFGINPSKYRKNN